MVFLSVIVCTYLDGGPKFQDIDRRSREYRNRNNFPSEW